MNVIYLNGISWRRNHEGFRTFVMEFMDVKTWRHLKVGATMLALLHTLLPPFSNDESINIKNLPLTHFAVAVAELLQNFVKYTRRVE
jgi:hypothetical protein